MTQQFPEYKRPVYPRFRGRHRLHRHENGLEKCVGCSLCAAACPADCIRVVADENDPAAPISAGERHARIYEINLSRCIYCGYCEIACPFDAITLGNDYELAEMSREAMVYTKEMLLDAVAGAAPHARGPGRSVRRGGRGDGSVSDLIGAGTAETIVFIAATALAIASALGVVLSGNPFRSALWLILNLVSLATFYLLLSADFLAAAQVIVYAGAVMIMFLFVIAYLGGAADEPAARHAALAAGRRADRRRRAGHRGRAGDRVARVRRRTGRVAPASAAPSPSRCRCSAATCWASRSASVVLLVAAVGGVVLGARRPAPRGPNEAEPFTEQRRSHSPSPSCRRW